MIIPYKNNFFAIPHKASILGSFKIIPIPAGADLRTGF